MNPRDVEEVTLTKFYGGLIWEVLSNLCRIFLRGVLVLGFSEKQDQ